ncbi:MAG: PTS sugar transporter subunit IIA [Calditrichia bacterium]
MRINDYLTADRIVVDLPGEDKYKVIETLLQALVDDGAIRDREKALKDLIEREEYLSTGLENGLAIPHAKSEAVDDVLIAFGVQKAGMDFDSLDGDPTNYVFLLLSPMDTSGPHIKMLAKIAVNFQDDVMLGRLANAATAEEYMAIFNDFK